MSNLLLILKSELLSRNYSRKTVSAYTGVIMQCYKFFRKPLSQVSSSEYRHFFSTLIERGFASQTISLYANAVNFVMFNIYKQKNFEKLKHPKRSRKIPIVLTKAEILQILSHIRNRKHKCMIALAYGAGLRVSEVVNIRVQDFDFSQRLLYIRQAKGKKDRVTILPSTLIPDIQFFTHDRNPRDIVFESAYGGKLTTSTLQLVFRRALHSSGINKPASFHSLRHSFATHLIESGTNIRYVQELLGHNSIRTTEIYTHVTNVNLAQVQSPL